MSKLFDLVRREPVAVTTAVQSLITLVTTFGLQLTPEQIGAILLVTSSILALIARSSVTSNVEAAKQVEAALNTPVPEKTN